MELKNLQTKTDKFTGYAYIVDGENTILARCNSETVAAEIVSRIQILDTALMYLREVANTKRSGTMLIGDIAEWLALIDD